MDFLLCPRVGVNLVAGGSPVVFRYNRAPAFLLPLVQKMSKKKRGYQSALPNNTKEK